MAASNLQSLCLLPVSGLYVYEADTSTVSGNFVLCSELGATCLDKSCDCRNSTASAPGNSTVHFTVCVDDDLPCTGPQYVNCSSFSASASASATSPDAIDRVPNIGNEPAPAASSSKGSGTTSSSTTTSASGSSPTDSTSGASTDSATTTPTASTSSSISTSVIVIAVVAFLLLVALVVWFVRKGSTVERKTSGQISNPSALSPTNSAGDSSATPSSFPAFDRRGRGVNAAGGVYRPHPATNTRVLLDTDMQYETNDARAYVPPVPQRVNTAVRHMGTGPASRAEWNRFRGDKRLREDSMPSSTTVRSTATTVEIPGRRRSPLPLQRGRQEQWLSVVPPQTAYSFQSSSPDASEIYTSDTTSEVAWSLVSGLSTQSCFSVEHENGSEAEVKPVPDRALLRQSGGLNRSSEASFASFFTVGPEADDEDGVYRHTEAREL